VNEWRVQTLPVTAAIVLVAVVAVTSAAVMIPRHLKMRRSIREIEAVITDLRSGDAKIREQAADRLSELEKRALPVPAGLLALRSAAGSFPVARGLDDGGTLLVSAAAEHPSDEYAPVVVQNFRTYSPNARFWALRLLANAPDRELGARSILELLRKDTAICEGLDVSQALSPMVARGAKSLFPEILGYLRNERLGMSVAYLTFEALSKDGVSSETLKPFSEPLLALYLRRRGLLVPKQHTEGHRWMWEEGYLEARDDAGLLLDLFGYVPSDRARQELLRATTEYVDPKLLTFAGVSLVRLGESVTPNLLERAASSPETRNTLHKMLGALNRPELFPRRYRTQEALAESEMVNWLVYPTELGQVPDEIELMKVVTAGDPGEEQDYYVYRFRMHEPHWAAKDGWMAGVAGAFAHGVQPTTEAQGDTFSSFAAWGSKTPEEHVGAVTKLLGDAWKLRAKEARGKGVP
jgi:hypothetical protein